MNSLGDILEGQTVGEGSLDHIQQGLFCQNLDHFVAFRFGTCKTQGKLSRSHTEFRYESYQKISKKRISACFTTTVRHDKTVKTNDMT